MKRLKTDELIPGMVIAEDIYNYNNQLILPKGLILTDKAISKIQFHAVYQVRVEDELAKIENPPELEPISLPEIPTVNISELIPEPVIDAPISSSPETKTEFSLPTVSYQDKLKSSQDFQQFKQAFDEEVNDFKSAINEVVLKNAPLDVDILLDDALNLISHGKGSFSVFDMLHSMRENDDATYAHCLNVALFCNVFAGWLKLSEEEIRLATLCGLLHDVGKLKVPESLLKKPDFYTAEEQTAIKAHTREGYMLIRNLDIDSHVKNAVLAHHERCDGTGYPFGLSGFRIDPYAKMVAIADVYDAMTSKRPYRNAMSPIQAIEVLQDEGLQKYDVRYIMVFLENVMNTFIGNRVLLSSGEKGEIIFINKSNITRPTIKCQGHFVDLDQEKEIQIVSFL